MKVYRSIAAISVDEDLLKVISFPLLTRITLKVKIKLLKLIKISLNKHATP